ncbi:hypothetical protein QZH41_014380, partial [Actinostola sp. cb2023]
VCYDNNCATTHPYSTCKDVNGKATCVCPTVCPRTQKPVCGSDGKPYANECEMRVASCKNRKKITKKSDGPCGKISTCSDNDIRNFVPLFQVTLSLENTRPKRIMACTVTVDAAFLVDSSGSVGRSNWARLLRFVSQVIAKLNVGPTKSHIALVRYSSNAEVDIYFNTLRGSAITSARYGSIITRLRWQRGFTFIDKALTMANEQVFLTSRGMRANVKKVAFMITDGKQTRDRGRYTPLKTASGRLQAKGVRVYSMAIGSRISNDELKAVASKPEYIFKALSFRKLQSEINKIVRSLCEGKRPSFC